MSAVGTTRFLLVLTISLSAMAQATVDKITVNGVTGQTSGGSMAPYGPDQFVEVEITPANLIVYSYSIAVDNTEQLKAFVPPIVGASDAATIAPGRSIFDTTFDAELSGRTVGSNQSLLQQYRKARLRVQEVAEKAAATVTVVDEEERRIDRQLAGNPAQWPPELAATRALYLQAAYGLVDTSRQTATTPTQAFNELTNRGEGRTLCSAGSLCEMASVAASAVQALIDAIDDAKLADARAHSTSTDREDFTLLDRAAAALSSEVTRVRTSLASTRDRVDRWNAVMLRYGTPKLSQRVLIDRISRRYVVTVTRRPLSAPPPATGQPDTAVEKLATTMFEGHTLSRLLFAAGVGALYKPDVREFSVQTRLDGDTKKFFVEQKSSTKTEFKPMMSIGAYFRPVDNFKVIEKWEPRAFVSVGSELSSSPSTYVVGGGFDFPAGVTFSAGITSYTGTDLGPGYKIGQEIAGTGEGAARVPLVTTETLPLRTRRLVGYYLSVQFRPAIFAAFRALAN